jgi:2-polyprenyl-3-methyl-5-hydroxy-6-metoxy-1,4-benzoquinol methylase
MTPASEHVIDPGMQGNLHAVGQMINYRRWIYETIAPHLGFEILEAGCGNGNLTSLILQKPGLRRYVGVDHSSDLCQQLRELIKDVKEPRCDVIATALEDERFTALEKTPFDTIICLNVLEHIEEDGKMLSVFRRLLKPGGKVVLLVPAFQWLYGTIDKIIHHHRRYSKKDLLQKITNANLSPVVTRYFNPFGIPAWVWHGKILKLSVHRETEMKAWDKYVPCLKLLENLNPFPIGLSLFAVAKRP